MPTPIANPIPPEEEEEFRRRRLMSLENVYVKCECPPKHYEDPTTK